MTRATRPRAGDLRHPSTQIAVVLLLAGTTACVATEATGQSVVGAAACVECHAELTDSVLAAPARLFPDDIHAERGFDCLACHGPDAGPGSTSREHSAGFLSAPERGAIPRLCGRCHSDAAFMRDFDPALRVDQVAEYWTSVHGQRLRSRGDEGVATCTDCHIAHRTRPPDDPESPVHPRNVADTCASCHSDRERMAGRGLSTDQHEEYRTSVHGTLLYEEGDLSAPTCNDCHGNHGAAPPGVTSVRNVCGQCHAVMAELLSTSAHSDLFETDDYPGCETCHGNHAVVAPDDGLLDRVTDDVCAECHGSAGDPFGFELVQMHALIDSLMVSRERGRAVLLAAENAGMEVSDALFRLDEVFNALTQARNAVHTLRVEPVEEEVRSGLDITVDAYDRGIEALEEFEFRRLGLWVSSAIIAVLILALGLKVRSIETGMTSILESAESFFQESMAAVAAGSASPEQIRLAASALLLELAYADEDFSAEERTHLEELIRAHFDLGRKESDALIALAESQRLEGVDINQLTRLLARELSEDQKMELLRVMWSLVFSDGVLATREYYWMSRLGERLGIDADAMDEARRRAEARTTS